MTPLNQRRLANFRGNRRGWVSLWLFLGLFGLTLGAEVIANDKPLLVWVDGVHGHHDRNPAPSGYRLGQRCRARH